ncbi:MAG: chain-length determining protein [Muribaculaceae bacterium]|nr:chain-length determining protein [Muribaculaceae bacterium]
MAEENLKDIRDNNDDEGTIDLLEIASNLWDHRRKLIKWSICGAVIGLIVAFSIPREYTTSVKLAPEVNDNKATGGSMAALASMAGMATFSGGADAVYPMLYPDVVSSVPFITSLFDVEVQTKEDGRKMTVQQFMEEETSSPWWSVIISAPFKLIGLLLPQEEEDPNHHLDNFQLTKSENDLVKELSERITASVDAKTSVVTVDVSMQDPLVSGILADTVVNRLKEFVSNYRTNKARNDLEYAETLKDEAQAAYYKAQQHLANYLDRNQGIVFRSAQVERERLENETALAFNLYNSTCQQVQRAQAKVQEDMPVYAVITPPTVPVKPSKPRKALILIGFTFLAFISCAVWIQFLQPMIAEHKASRAGRQGALSAADVKQISADDNKE